ncbi:MAG: flagellar hook-associated protein FlgK [Phycisphaerae bacterium]
MGLFNSSLHIGRSALLSYQSALQTVGNNISSAGSTDYTRLSPQLDPLNSPLRSGQLQPGAGVALTGIQRNIDDALESRLRDAIGAHESGFSQQTSLARIESFLDDVNGTGVETHLRNFFSSFDQLQNRPEDSATRDLAISSGQQLAGSLQQLRQEFANLGFDLNSQIEDIVIVADELANKIGQLNGEIVTAEAGNFGQATGLRDQRDGLLRDLAEIVDTTVREQDDGSINVYIGSEALIQGDFVRGLTTVEEVDGEFVRTSIEFADTNGRIDIRGGQLHGLIVSRDAYGYGQVQVVDELASSIIRDVNRIHANGQGLIGFNNVTAAFDLGATDLPLNDPAVGLQHRPETGSFFITVTDDISDTPVSHRINVDFDTPGSETTLQSLVDNINAEVEGVTASISPGNRLTLTADDGVTFTFGHDGEVAREDTSFLLASLGINNYFEGRDARDITIAQHLNEQPLHLAAATANFDGDGTNAATIAALETTETDALNGTTIREFYNTLVGSVAVASAAARDDLDAASTVLSSLEAQRENISGVNLDEETISMLKYERAFQGVSRFVSVVDGLVNELVALIR